MQETTVTVNSFSGLSDNGFDDGDEFEVRVRKDGSNYEQVLQLTVDRRREAGDRNGFLKAYDSDGEHHRFYVRGDGRISIAKGWSATDRVVRAVAHDHGVLAETEYKLVEAPNGDVELREKTQAAGPSL
jgi:hypothetical protein